MATGKLVAIIGLVLVLIGLVLTYAPWLINWFGTLPGDILIEDENKRIYIPITSMLIISLILSIVVNLFFRK